jgi:hypothetical protein
MRYTYKYKKAQKELQRLRKDGKRDVEDIEILLDIIEYIMEELDYASEKIWRLENP